MKLSPCEFVVEIRNEVVTGCADKVIINSKFWEVGTNAEEK